MIPSSNGHSLVLTMKTDDDPCFPFLLLISVNLGVVRLFGRKCAFFGLVKNVLFWLVFFHMFSLKKQHAVLDLHFFQIFSLSVHARWVES